MAESEFSEQADGLAGHIAERPRQRHCLLNANPSSGEQVNRGESAAGQRTPA